MTIDRKSLGINLNTVISALTLVVMLGGWIYYWANTVRDIEELKEWKADHEKTVETRLAESREVRGQTEIRIKAMEKALIDTDRRTDQTTYRVTVIETALASQEQQQQKISDDLSELKGDMKVIKEAILRLDASNGKRRLP